MARLEREIELELEHELESKRTWNEDKMCDPVISDSGRVSARQLHIRRMDKHRSNTTKTNMSEMKHQPPLPLPRENKPVEHTARKYLKIKRCGWGIRQRTQLEGFEVEV